MGYVKMLRESVSHLVLIAVFFFIVTPAAGAAPFSFVVIGDNNSFNLEILAEIAQATVDEHPDFVLFAGDLTFGYNGTQADFEAQLMDWRNIMQPVYDACISVYPCRGNHDAAGVNPAVDPDGTLSLAAWNNIFSGAYALPGNGPDAEKNITFSFTHKNALVVGIDEYGSHPHQVNQRWLDEQLGSNTLPHVFVFGHEPAFKTFHPDCLDDYPAARDEFWQSIAGHCGRTYFGGHDHAYNHARVDDGDGNPDNDVHQFVAGTSGSPFYNWNGSYNGDNGTKVPQLVYFEKQYGYILVTVDDLNVTVAWKHRTAPGMYEAGGDTFAYTSVCGPTVIELAAFTAAPKASKIIVAWITETETANAGFNLYRSEKEHGEYIKMALLPSEYIVLSRFTAAATCR